jgi:hypothetical protein
MPTPTDAADLPWPDYLRLNLSRQARREGSERPAPRDAPAPPATSADVLPQEHQVASDGARTQVAGDHEDTLQVPDLQVPDLQMPDLQMADLQMADLQVPDTQVTDSGSAEPAVRARSVEGDRSATGSPAALAAAVAAAGVAGRSASADHGRGSLRRSQWSARPDIPPAGGPDGQDEAGASPDELVLRHLRGPAVRAAVLVVALILGSVILFMSGALASTASRGTLP